MISPNMDCLVIPSSVVIYIVFSISFSVTINIFGHLTVRDALREH